MLYNANISYNVNYINNTDIVNNPDTSVQCDVIIEASDQVHPNAGALSISAPISWTETITVTGEYCNLGNINGGNSQTFTLESDPDCQYGNALGDCVDNLSQNVNVYFNPPIGCTNPNSCNYDSGAEYDDGSCDAGPYPGTTNVSPIYSDQTFCLGSELQFCVILSCINHMALCDSL